MRTATSCAIAAALALTVTAEQSIEPARPESVGMSREGLQKAGAIVRQSIADRQIAGAVGLVARRGRVVWLDAVGSQTIDPPAPMQDRSLFRIYSMTRAVTSVAIMLLAESNQLSLSDPVRKYLPEFANVMVQGEDGVKRPPARDIIVEDLMLHTSGISDRNAEVYRQRNVRSRSIRMAQLITNITDAPLMEDPGTRFRYGESTSVLGAIVEAVSKQPLDRFMAARIFVPLGMIDTGFWADGDQRARLTTAYRVEAGALISYETEETPFTSKPQLLEGTVGLLSTAPDFFRFSQMLLQGGEWQGRRFLGARSVALLTQNGLSAPVVQQRSGGAMGWARGNLDVVLTPNPRGYLTATGEYGWDGSVGGFFSVDPAKELIVILLTQNSPANPNMLRQRFKAAVLQSMTP